MYINFTQYAPTKIVDNLQIKSKTLEVWAPAEILWFMPNKFEVDLSLDTDGSYISESKVATKDIALDKIQCSAINVKCSLEKTESGQAYAQYSTYDPADYNQVPLLYNRLTDERVYFIKDDTFILINFQLDNKAPISTTEWSNMIDSFKPTTFTNLTVTHKYPGP